MASSRRLTVEIIGDASSLEKTFKKAGKQSRSFGQVVGTASKFAAGALGGLGLAAKLGFDEFREGQKVGAQTAAVLKSTGGAAGVTRKQVEGLAGSLSDLSGVDDELIQSAENVLLTFTNVGKKGGVFDAATKAALDMSTALGTDLQGATMQIGKALNDPIKGITALSRVGVSFTKEQKDQIRALVDSGRTMKAQKIILRELNKEFGGSAKAAGIADGGVNRLKNQFAEMTAGLIQGLMPAFQTLVKELSRATAWMTTHQKAVKVVAAVVAGLAVGVLALNAALKVARAAQVAFTAAQWLLNAALTANPIGIVVVALAALAAGIVVAYKKSETFRTVVTAVFNAAKRVVLEFIDVFLNVVSKFIGGLAAIAKAATRIPFIGGKFKGVAEAIQGAQDSVEELRESIHKLNRTPVKLKISEGRGIDRIAGARQHGGPVTAGRTYLVGESGPELFRAFSSGTIEPARSSLRAVNGSQPIVIHNYIDLDGRRVAESTLTYLHKAAKLSPSQRSGRHGGTRLGLA